MHRELEHFLSLCKFVSTNGCCPYVLICEYKWICVNKFVVLSQWPPSATVTLIFLHPDIYKHNIYINNNIYPDIHQGIGLITGEEGESTVSKLTDIDVQACNNHPCSLEGDSDWCQKKYNGLLSSNNSRGNIPFCCPSYCPACDDPTICSYQILTILQENATFASSTEINASSVSSSCCPSSYYKYLPICSIVGRPPCFETEEGNMSKWDDEYTVSEWTQQHIIPQICSKIYKRNVETRTDVSNVKTLPTYLKSEYVSGDDCTPLNHYLDYYGIISKNNTGVS
eukprot:GHVR01155304.1.p1 GENE.GHVR01155304.1~~GHVR01155304.1.p1  ORF type:complete len:283 (-),score=44.79 GHVR01155304.1:144-992(-)